ncbi:hypothetical protein KAS08_02475 [Candidatus Pacearchaeota archaeon]|nr:hypothetical protein [Candidatus Pacearchaeota archaeon]
MAKNNNGLILGLGMLTVTGVGVYFYLKNKGFDFSKLANKNLSNGSSGGASVGTKEISSAITDSANEPTASITSSSSDGSSSSGKSSYSGRSKSSGGEFLLGQTISRKKTITPTVFVSSNNSPAQNVTIGANLPTYTSPSGTKEAGHMSIIVPNSSEGSSIVSQIGNKVSSGINSAKSFVSRLF